MDFFAGQEEGDGAGEGLEFVLDLGWRCREGEVGLEVELVDGLA